MDIQQLLFQYLLSNVPSRMMLVNRLSSDANEINCYYICTFSTLRMVIQEGIKCREDISIKVDLSSPAVQSRRNTVWLGCSSSSGIIHKKPNIPIHSCVNFFWNPVNRTLEAFQRNGILYAEESQHSEDGIICIIEINLIKLLTNEDVYWVITNRNVASDAFSTFEEKYYRNFPWSKIFAVGPYTKDYPHQERAAEVIVFINKNGCKHSQPVPSDFIDHVYIPKHGNLDIKHRNYFRDNKISISHSDVFKEPKDLIKSESMFLYNLSKFLKADKDCTSRIVKAFELSIEFENMFGGPTRDRFLSTKIASGNHGTGHTVRVIFWSIFLSTYYYGMNLTPWHQVIYISALVHDLARQGDYDIVDHGKKAVDAYNKFIGELITDSSKRESCLNAVSMHSMPDNACPIERRDEIWGILKDADALDRGRFSTPDNERGCKLEFLRLDYMPLKKPFKESVPWMAYQLAGMTKLSRWDDSPCKRLALNFYYGISAGLSHGVYWGESLTIAREFTVMMRKYL